MRACVRACVRNMYTCVHLRTRTPDENVDEIVHRSRFLVTGFNLVSEATGEATGAYWICSRPDLYDKCETHLLNSCYLSLR